MRNRIYTTALAILMASATASAQLEPTVMGFVHDGDSRELRPILGVPGSAYIGTAVASNLDAAWPAPSGKYGLARRGNQTLLITSLNRLAPVVVEDTRLLMDTTLVVWSVDARSAVLYSSSTQRFQRIQMNGSGVDIDPPSEGVHLGSVLSALAIHSDGRIAIAFDQTQIYIARSGGGPTNLVVDEGVNALGFAPSGEQVYLATTSSLKVINTSGDSKVRTLVEGLSNPVGLLARADGIYVATSGDNKIRRFSSDGHIDFDQDLDRKPEGLFALYSDSVLLLNGAAGRNPAIIVDTRSQPSVFFIPNSAGSSL